MVIPERVAERAYNAWVGDENGCYISTYSTASHGYAQIGWDTGKRDAAGNRLRKGTTAHRAAWTHAHGQIPDGMTIDHTCKNRRCVNVDHLRMLTNFENARRTSGRDWPLGQCINGHPNTFMNMNVTKAYCRACSRDQYLKNRDKIIQQERERRRAKKRQKPAA